MALLTAQVMTATTGLVPSYAAVAASDTFVAGPGRYLHLKNTNAATRTVTVTTESTAAGGAAVADWSGTIGATTGELLFPVTVPQFLHNATTGVGTVTCSATAGVTIALIEIPGIA